MNEKIRSLLDQINRLEDDLRNAVHESEEKALSQIKSRQHELEESVRQKQHQYKQSFFHWIVTYRPQNLITGPIIYGMILPLLMLDLCVSLYQASCFPIYKITKVRRCDYIVFDRQHLHYLNAIEKFHCTYCAYANGLMAYVSEIVARTEEYFCPIKHARKVLATHLRYGRFLPYGEEEDYEKKLEEIRVALGDAPAPCKTETVIK
jgi:hypothetical protein